MSDLEFYRACHKLHNVELCLNVDELNCLTHFIDEWFEKAWIESKKQDMPARLSSIHDKLSKKRIDPTRSYYQKFKATLTYQEGFWLWTAIKNRKFDFPFVGFDTAFMKLDQAMQKNKFFMLHLAKEKHQTEIFKRIPLN